MAGRMGFEVRFTHEMIAVTACGGCRSDAGAGPGTRATIPTMAQRAVVVPSVLLGIGLGAIIDASVFHAILQWHHVASARIPAETLDGLRSNVRLDGILLALMWLLTVAALVMLWRAFVQRGELPPGGVVAGGAVAGWGGFNLYDGIVDHYVLGLHHTTSGPDPLFLDLVIIVWGLAFLVGGAALVRRLAASAPASPDGSPAPDVGPPAPRP